MPRPIQQLTDTLIASARLYRELAVSALTLLPARPQRTEARVRTATPRLVEISAR